MSFDTNVTIDSIMSLNKNVSFVESFQEIANFEITNLMLMFTPQTNTNIRNYVYVGEGNKKL